MQQGKFIVLLENLKEDEVSVGSPVATGLHAFRKCNVAQGDTLLIYGIDNICMLVAQWARKAGVKNIVLADRDDEMVEAARKMGFSPVVNATGGVLEKMVRENTEGRGADVCVEGTGVSEALAECINIAKSGGTVVCVGLQKGEMNLSEGTYQEIRKKELTMAGVWKGEGEWLFDALA